MEASLCKLSSQEREAADETTRSDLLGELAKINIKLARLVTNNPSAPAEILQELSWANCGEFSTPILIFSANSTL